MMDVMAKVLPIDWTVVVQGGNGTRARLPIYDNADWAKGFDLVVHNECSADVDDDAFVKRITDAAPRRADSGDGDSLLDAFVPGARRPTPGASSSA